MSKSSRYLVITLACLLGSTPAHALAAYSYDALGRPVLADRGTTGNPTAVSHTVFAYTGLGDLDYETQTLDGGTPRTIDYGHDQAGNRTSVTYPSGEALAYVPTALNQVDAVSLNASPLLDYSYAGQRLDKRRTTTDDGVNTTVYEVGWGYDDHRRINGIDNLLEVNATPQTVAAYAFSHDNNGNPLSQTAGGTPDFAADDRTFTVDTLNRLTDTFYADTGTTESSVFDRVGNRESHTDRAGALTNYALANAANEYSTIGGQPVTYDAAGNLTTDEDGRTYEYDERNRLIVVRDSGATLLAAYSYDALGRRVVSTIGTVTTRYYYDGQNVIEERDGSDVRIRYHVNGAQFIDERVTTFEDGSSAFTYYLLKENFSVAGTANADGSTVERLDYSATGSFAGAGGGIDVDYDDDGFVDADDFAAFEACASGPAVPQNNPACADKKLDADADVDQSDFGIFQRCYSGTELAPPECTGAGGGLPTSGTFVMHGRPVDVLPDGHTLLYVRARFYDLKNGRWLQRDPIGYADTQNLYEAFGSNPGRFVDPSGRWIAERVAEILGEKGQVTVGDVQALGKELNSDARHQIRTLTENELQLLKLLGGPAHGTPWTESTLSPWLQDEAQERFAGLGATYRNRAMATLATRRRILYLLAFNSSAFSNYVTELYRVSRDINPVHFAAERGIQVGTGTETITGQKVSRWRAGGEFVVYLALVKGFQAGPSAITRALGGEVPGALSAGVVPGRSTTLNRSEVRFSQRTAGGRGRAEPLRQSLRERGFTEQIDVVEVSPGQYVAVDNTRLAIAQELNIGRIPARVFQPEDPLPPEMVAGGRFGEAARTWGDAILFRTAKQRPPLPPEGTPDVPRVPGATP